MEDGFFSEQKGQALIEYALLFVLISVLVVVILALAGPGIGAAYSNIVAGL